MKNYRDSDYAVNKYSKSIVYRFTDKVVEVTLEAYLAANPDKTEKDFEELKALSDEIYYEQDRSENAQTKKNVSVHSLEETDKLSTLPLEDEYIRRREEQLLEDIIDEHLTEKQARRIRLCIHHGLSSRKIAKLEGLHYRTIQDSLVLAKKKIEKYLSETRMVNYYCSTGRIKGSLKKGNLWLIPSNAEKPVDGRAKENKRKKSN